MNYLFNKFLALISFVSFSFLWVFILSFNFDFTIISIITALGLFVGVLLNLHYFMNLVHMASHGLIFKNSKLNRLIGTLLAIPAGLTFADFKTTHMLHHARPRDAESDPDHTISTYGPLWLMPFRVFYHDIFFWREGLYKKNGWGRDYVFTRLVQVGLVSSLILSGNMLLWIGFWLIPMLLVGLLNGLFLFYFPHYTIVWEKYLRSSDNILFKGLLWLVDLSRVYHHKHHQKIRQEMNYFPVFGFFWERRKNWQESLNGFLEAKENAHLRFLYE